MCQKNQKAAGNLTQHCTLFISFIYFFTSLTRSMLEGLQLSLITRRLYCLSVLCLQYVSPWFVLSVAVCGPERSLQLTSVCTETLPTQIPLLKVKWVNHTLFSPLQGRTCWEEYWAHHIQLNLYTPDPDHFHDFSVALMILKHLLEF